VYVKNVSLDFPTIAKIALMCIWKVCAVKRKRKKYVLYIIATESFNPSLENVWAERCTHMPGNVIFSFPVTNLLLVLFVLTEILACANARKKKGLTDFKFHFLFYWLFSGDMVVKVIMMRKTNTPESRSHFFFSYSYTLFVFQFCMGESLCPFSMAHVYQNLSCQCRWGVQLIGCLSSVRCCLSCLCRRTPL